MKEGNEERDRKNETRDKKLDDLIKSLSTGLAEREKRTEERFENMERCLGAKMDEGVLDTIVLVLPKADGVPLQRA